MGPSDFASRFFDRRRNITATTTKAMTATPPIVPPTIGPIGGFDLDSATGVGVGVGVVEDEELKELELELELEVELDDSELVVVAAVKVTAAWPIQLVR